MIKKKFETKTKLVNHLIIHGKKVKSEKIILQTLKTLQKTLKKSATKLFQTALTRNMPIFKINASAQKKQKKKGQVKKIFPAFISSKKARISLAINFTVKTALKEKNQPFFQRLLSEIYLSSQNKNSVNNLKKDIQKQALLNRRFFRYYRWH